MNVFISFSGYRSGKIAEIFRDWLPYVINSLEPFVSSKDIDKGARWNNEITERLKTASFGIICVTKENLATPWVNFEAGAISNVVGNSFVSPFLFDLNHIDITHSPLSQFQATLYNKDDIKQLIYSLNIASGKCLSENHINKAFDTWYPKLDDDLQKVRSESVASNDNEPAKAQSDILEELLKMSRSTHRLLGNTDIKLHNDILQLQDLIDEEIKNGSLSYDKDVDSKHKLKPMFLEEFYYLAKNSEGFNDFFPYNILIILSLYRIDYPWLYDAGCELVNTLLKNESAELIKIESDKFMKLLDFTCNNSLMQELIDSRHEPLILLREIPSLLNNNSYKQHK